MKLTRREELGLYWRIYRRDIYGGIWTICYVAIYIAASFPWRLLK